MSYSFGITLAFVFCVVVSCGLEMCSLRGTVLRCQDLGSRDLAAHSVRYSGVVRVEGTGWDKGFQVDAYTFPALRTVILKSSSTQCSAITYTGYSTHPLMIINGKICPQVSIMFSYTYFAFFIMLVHWSFFIFFMLFYHFKNIILTIF